MHAAEVKLEAPAEEIGSLIRVDKQELLQVPKIQAARKYQVSESRNGDVDDKLVLRRQSCGQKSDKSPSKSNISRA